MKVGDQVILIKKHGYRPTGWCGPLVHISTNGKYGFFLYGGIHKVPIRKLEKLGGGE